MSLTRRFAPAAALTLLFAAAALPQTQTPAPAAAPQQNPARERLLGALDKTGYEYRKADDGLWVVTLEGKNRKEIEVFVHTAGTEVVVQTHMAERKAVADKAGLLVKLLELNHEYDTVKVSLSPDMLYARAEIPGRLLDAEYLKYLINQLAILADEAEPQLRPLPQPR